MSIYKGNEKSIIVKGNFHPAELYKGSSKIAGYNTSQKQGQNLSFENTYNDTAGVTLYGQTSQNGLPSPDSPVPLTSVQNPTITSMGRNLRPNEKIAFNSSANDCFDIVSGINHVTVTCKTAIPAGGWMTINAGSLCTANLKPSTTYTVFCKRTQHIDGVCVMDVYGSGQLSNMPNFNNGYAILRTKAFSESDKNGRILYFTANGWKGSAKPGDICELSDVMVVEGDYSSAPLPYEPYKTSDITLGLSLRHIEVPQNRNPNVSWQDADGKTHYAVADTYEGNGIITKRIGEVIFDGSADEVWYTEAAGGYRRFTVRGCFPDPVQNLWGGVKCGQECSHFTQGLPGYQASDCFSFDNTPNFCLQYNAVATIANLRAWLAAQYAAGTPVTVDYVLKTPVIEKIAPQAIPTYRGFTYVSADQGTISAKVKYYEV